ncbi:MAG TPA: ATP-binding protein [Bacteroidia bacterium]|nr:ATP-binding protein [Bacteroidia bacterium]
MELKIGLDTISNYKRLSYTPWHAIAEFIDNSTQSFFNNNEVLEKAFKEENEILRVDIVYERDDDVLRISDNSIGMSYEELEGALYVGKPPLNSNGRSKYGLGLKTAACWLGDVWIVKTKKLGNPKEYSVTIDVEKIANGENTLITTEVDVNPDLHYSIIEIKNLNRKFPARTSGKIKAFLKSMYRIDFRNKYLKLTWQGEELKWEEIEERILKDIEGKRYKKLIKVNVLGKDISGWVAILERGSRADAGFSIIQSDRVIKGWPDSWRPSKIYGQDQGSNDLINQRLFGEIHLDGFTVSHTKDSILWFGDEEEEVEKALSEVCMDYREVAKEYRKNKGALTGPSPVATTAAIDELKKELSSPEMVDEINLTEIPNEEALNETFQDISDNVQNTQMESMNVTIGTLILKVYLNSELSPNDPYVLIEASKPQEIIIIINQSHPHWMQLKDTEVLNYFRHCTYDGVAEWQARNKVSRIDPHTIKLLKDNLLRVQYIIEGNEMEQNTEWQ